MEISELQQQVVVEICQIMTTAWDAIELHYEDGIVDGHQRTVYKAFYFEGGVKVQFGLSGKCHQLLFELGDRKVENCAEGWTWFDLRVDNTGKYGFDFGYDTPRLLKREIELFEKYPEEK